MKTVLRRFRASPATRSKSVKILSAIGRQAHMSATASARSSAEPRRTPPGSRRTILRRSMSIAAANRSGDSGQPCRTPLATSKQQCLAPPMVIAQEFSVYRAAM
eukprot:1750427-Pyramimonas_sp.AAC.1